VVDPIFPICYNNCMKNATLSRAELLNEFEVLLVADYMEQNHPNIMYTMAPGNECIWVYYQSINLYFVFRAGKIAEIQVD
jgi:hypothetical protein